VTIAPITWDGIATIIAAFVAAGIVMVGFVHDRKLQNRGRRAEAFAGALQAVSDYLEAPYRIRRRSGSREDRFALTSYVSEIQSRLDFFDAHLALIAPKVHPAYLGLVAAAKSEAGVQMTGAWNSCPTHRDRQVPVTTPYAHPRSDAARVEALVAMKDSQ
jgi:hypothetical protein